jgi:hypothetical protein
VLSGKLKEGIKGTDVSQTSSLIGEWDPTGIIKGSGLLLTSNAGPELEAPQPFPASRYLWRSAFSISD